MPPGENSRSLNEAVKRDIDTSRVKFDRGFTQISKGSGNLVLTNGVLRGPVIGATFQGTLYDKQGNMDMTGTFMPAYGLNRLFGEIPVVGAAARQWPRPRPDRRDLQAGRRRQLADRQHQSAVGHRSGHLPVDLRVPVNRQTIARPVQSARTSMCFFLPSDSLTAPSSDKSARVTVRRSSVTG